MEIRSATPGEIARRFTKLIEHLVNTTPPLVAIEIVEETSEVLRKSLDKTISIVKDEIKEGLPFLERR